jgi:hypothetical protein
LCKTEGKVKKQLAVNDKPMIWSQQQYSWLANPLFSTLENTVSTHNVMFADDGTPSGKMIMMIIYQFVWPIQFGIAGCRGHITTIGK